MASDTDRFLQAEEMAERLSRGLGELHDAASAHRDATEQLSAVRQHIVGFVEQTRQLTQGTHDVIKKLQEIATPEILARMESISMQLGRLETNNLNQQKRIKLLATIAIIFSVLAVIEGLLLLLK